MQGLYFKRVRIVGSQCVQGCELAGLTNRKPRKAHRCGLLTNLENPSEARRRLTSIAQASNLFDRQKQQVVTKTAKR
jgi:hypothetical protein